MPAVAASPRDSFDGLCEPDSIFDEMDGKIPSDGSEDGRQGVEEEYAVIADPEVALDDDELELEFQSREAKDGDEIYAEDGDYIDNKNGGLHREHHDIMSADEDEESVGAVKIRPGDMQYEHDYSQVQVDDGSEVLESHSDESSASDASDVPPGTEDEDDIDGSLQHICIFCRQDEDDEPDDDFEAILTCSKCGTHSHQQCARNEYTLEDGDDGSYWTCPRCNSPTNLSSMSVDGVCRYAIRGQFDCTNDVQSGNASLPNRFNSSATQSVELHIGAHPSHGVTPNQAAIGDDYTMGGTGVLRKRKTSPYDPACPQDDTNFMALRKRRKNEDGDEAHPSTIVYANSSRVETRRPHPGDKSLATVEESRDALFVTFHLVPSILRGLLSTTKTDGTMHKRSTRRTIPPQSARSGCVRSGGNRIVPAGSVGTTPSRIFTTDLVAPFLPSAFSQPFYSFFDKETDEMKGKPYGGILTELEADTSRTLPLGHDRRQFDDAKQRAEDEWKSRVLSMQTSIDIPLRKAKKPIGPASQIECIEFGGWEIDTWYAAPYPEEYSRNRVLYICEFCLKYMNSDYVAWRHKLKCPVKHPPGDEIYRSGSVSVFEVDGRKNPVYCQNLCLLAKLFLGSKTLYYDVEPFLFYVLCEYDNLGYHFVGYFSKEKRASSQNNVSCILTLPIHQRKGYGNLLIDFSYLLTRVERKHGSPEKPLSDMGLVSYRNYWRLMMCEYLLAHLGDTIGTNLGGGGRRYCQHHNPNSCKGLSIRQISDDTGLTPDDVVCALEGLRCLIKDPQTGLYGFRIDLAYCRDYVSTWEAKNYVRLDPTALTWTPYVAGRSNIANFELNSSIGAIAPRDDAAEGPNAPALDTSDGTSIGNKVVQCNAVAINSGHALPILLDPNAETAVLMESNGGQTQQTASDYEGPSQQGARRRIGLESISHNFAHVHDTILRTQQQTSWAAAYNGIPPTRFVVFPPALNSRRADRARAVMTRPPVSARGDISRLKGTPAHSSSGPNRATVSSGSAAAKRKTGGTGRGPGRWPKGTKKSDYGNAESGPGLPPAWIKARQEARERESREVRDTREKTNKLHHNGDASPDLSSRDLATAISSTHEYGAEAAIENDDADVVEHAMLRSS